MPSLAEQAVIEEVVLITVLLRVDEGDEILLVVAVVGIFKCLVFLVSCSQVFL